MSEKKNYYALNKSLQRFDEEVSHIYDKSLDQGVIVSNDSGSNIISTAELDENSSTRSERLHDFVRAESPSFIGSPDNIAQSESEQLFSSNSSISSNYENPSSSIYKPEFSLSNNLVQWYNDHNISHSALKSLLGILQPYHTELPLDPRTLLGTKSFEIEANGNGHFVYFGLEENIKKILSH